MSFATKVPLIAMLGGLSVFVWPSVVHAKKASTGEKAHENEEESSEGELSTSALEAAPLSLRGTRGAPHPDCTNGVPLWKHVVQPGEQLGRIAGRYGVRARQLAELNVELKDPNLIVPGQEIRVCPEIAPRVRERVTYKVKAGDNLTSIALAHGLTLSELLAEQPDRIEPKRLRVGTELEFWVDRGMPEAFRPPKPKPKPILDFLLSRKGIFKKR